MKKFFPVLMLMGGLVLSATAGAAVINGSIRNIDGDGDGAADDLKISRVMFDVTGGTHVFFDSLVRESSGVDLNGDGFITGFDNYMMLYSPTGQWLARVDDSNTTYNDGSVHHYDSAFGWTFNSAGTYMVTLGQLSYSSSQGLQGYEANRRYAAFNAKEAFGTWRLTMTPTGGALSKVYEVGVEAAPDVDLDVKVPEPGSLALLGAGLFGLAAWCRKAGKASART